MPEPKVKQLAVKNITADPLLQMRDKGLSEATVEEYAEAMKGGAEFPPLVVYHDGSGNNWLSEGFHRFTAAQRAGLNVVTVEMRSGTRKDAVVNAAGSNATHGLKRTNADKRRAVERMLAEFPGWNASEIARAVKVSHTYVIKLRKPPDEDEPSGDEIETFQSGEDGGSDPGEEQTQSGQDVASDSGVNDTADALSAQDSNGSGVAESDDSADKPEVTVTHASAEKSIACVEVVVRSLKKCRAVLSGLMHGPYAPLLRNVSESVTGCKLYATGETLSKGEWGGVTFGIAEHSTPAIDDMHTLCGAMKLALARADAIEVDAVASAPWEKADFDAVLRQDDDVIPI